MKIIMPNILALSKNFAKNEVCVELGVESVGTFYIVLLIQPFVLAFVGISVSVLH